MADSGKAPQILRQTPNHEQREGEDADISGMEKDEKNSASAHDQKLQHDEVQRDEHPHVHLLEFVSDVEQRQKHSDGHEEGVDHQRSREPKELAYDKFPPANRPRQHRVQRAFVNLFRNQANPDEDRDHHSEEADSRQPQVHHHEALDVDRDFSHQNRRPREQQRERDQVVQHPVAHCFAKSVEGDISDARSYAHSLSAFMLPPVSLRLSVGCSFWM